jgi:hypothetical protein
MMPATSDFETHVTHREPFIVRSSMSSQEGVQTSLDSVLNWKVAQWSNIDYLRETVGPEENILVETIVPNSQLSSTFGFSGRAYKSKMTFSSFLDRHFGKNNANTPPGTSEFLNLQDGYFRGDGIWNSPLQKLQADIPVPECLASRAENISSVNMWMSNAPEGIV